MDRAPADESASARHKSTLHTCMQVTHLQYRLTGLFL